MRSSGWTWALSCIGLPVLISIFQMRQVLTQREEIYEQLAHYLQLKNIIERLQESADPELHTQVDLGCNFYVSAEVQDPSRICVALGYGFFLELTLPEALRFIERKSRLLTSLSDSLTKDSAKIKANIRLVLEVSVGRGGRRGALPALYPTGPQNHLGRSGVETGYDRVSGQGQARGRGPLLQVSPAYSPSTFPA
uniref:Ubiquitously expressed prefoldin like chaperone n=1 Tax=Ornithorhynchus anatinus TaxID=9258 RepID=A0A6I8PFY1_ORNAN